MYLITEIFWLKSDGPRIDNSGTKIDLPPNLELVVQLKPTSKYNQNQTLGKLQHSRIELRDPSRSKMSLATSSMRSIAILIQHLVYVNTKVVSCISCLQSFSFTNPCKLWTPSFSSTKMPPLCLHFRNS